MLKELIHLANHLDQKGLRKEADLLDHILRKKADAQGRYVVKKRTWEEKIKRNEYGDEVGAEMETTFTVEDRDEGKNIEVVYPYDPIELQEMNIRRLDETYIPFYRAHNIRDDGFMTDEERAVRPFPFAAREDFVNALNFYISSNKLERDEFNPTDTESYKRVGLRMPEPSFSNPTPLPPSREEESFEDSAKDLIHLANHLDQKGLRKEADLLDRIIRENF